MRNFAKHPMSKGERGEEEERGLKVEGESVGRDGDPLGANESSR